MRDKTFQKKLAVDQKTRQLQNLLYELEHLKESVRTCLEFRSLHDEIDLIPKEEYIKTVCNADPDEIEHQQTLNRLYWELEQRKKLNGNLRVMSKSLSDIREKIASKQAYLECMNGNLRSILESTRSLDSDLGLNATENEVALPSSFALPSPLYVIYSRMVAFINVKDLRSTVSVKIIGDLDLARSVNTSSTSSQEEMETGSSGPDEQDTCLSNSAVAKRIISLKAINRRTQLRIKDMRDKTFQKKLAVDQKTRQLQNLLYELEHLKESVRTCLEFRSLHDEIDLIPKEEYIKTVCNADPDEIEHQQTLNRLYWELEQRKKLNGNLRVMSKSLSDIREKIASKQAYLECMNGNLRSILESTRSLDSDLGLNATENEVALPSSFALPSPLYVIYSRMVAFINVKDLRSTVSVKIIGDLDLARSVNTSSTSSQEEMETGSSGPDEQDTCKKSHRKSKRPRREEEERSHHKTDTTHPLSVVVYITTGPDAKWADVKLTLTFEWLMRAKLVSVRDEFHDLEKLCTLSQTARDLLSSSALFSHLQCDGEGARWQGEEPVDGIGYKDASSGKSYAWAQQLGGLQCLPHLESSTDSIASTSTMMSTTSCTAPFGFVDSWFTALSRRLEARLSLNAEIQAIESGVLNLSESQKPFFPISKDIGLSTWDRVTFEDIKTWPRAQTFIALDLIQSTDAIFKCQMAFQGKDVLTIGASIPASYPDDPSVIFLASNTDAFPAGDLNAMHIQELETEVNCYWREMPQEDGRTGEDEGDDSNSTRSAFSGKKPENLLTCQLARIASCLPIFLSSEGNSNAVGDIGPLYPQGGVR
nr:THO complex subunit 5 protein [Hymenolepis microstoma]